MEKKAWQLAENLHRKELTAMQRAEAYKEIRESYEKELGGKYGEQIVTTITETQEKLTGEKKAELAKWSAINERGMPEFATRHVAKP